MNLVAPQPGAVIRNAYLWADEHRVGREEGKKDRPAVVLALSVRNDHGTTEVMVLAVTHSRPARPGDAVAIPPAVLRQLGLDEEESFIVTTEANAFFWPGPDLRPIPGRKPRSVVYGKVPDALLRVVARSYLSNRKRQRAGMVRRT